MSTNKSGISLVDEIAVIGFMEMETEAAGGGGEKMQPRYVVSLHERNVCASLKYELII